MTAIVDVHARQILDSRGNPTVEVDVTLEDGSMGRAAVPSGASTGAHEAVELRDGDKSRWGGKGVEQGGRRRSTARSPRRSSGCEAEDQAELDAAMIALDGTENKGRLGANAILGVSLATAKAAADALGLPLYRYVGGVDANLLPVPMMNILNGGAHADNGIDFQEFMVMPVGAPNFAEALRCGAEIFHALKSALHQAGLSTAVGDEGGFAPAIAVGARGARLHREGGRARPATRSATTCCWRSIARRANISRTAPIAWTARARRCRRPRMADFLAELAADYPIASIEDGMAEDDMDGLEGADRQARRPRPAGRRRSVRHQRRSGCEQGIDDGIANSILIKVNQIGTLTETIDAVRLAQTQRLYRGDVAPLGRDRGFDHRRPRGRARLRADQDRQPGALGPHGEVQPAAADRGGARRRRRAMPGARRSRRTSPA